MDQAGLRWLLTAPGQAVLAELAEDAGFTEAALASYASRLRRTLPTEAVQAALEVALCRRKAPAKFPQGAQLYFTREALEQATPWPVAQHRVARFAGCAELVDLCCAAGGDALALAAQAPVLAVDQDPLRLALLEANAVALGLAARITPLLADVTTLAPRPAGVFFDPARRSAGKRIYDVEQYLPPLSTLARWQSAPVRAAKVAPGIADEQVPPDAALEFVSLDGELREAALWWGGLPPGERRATLLTSAGATATLLADPAAARAPLAAPGAFLYEPDPAVIRAHAVADLAALLGAAQLDADIAYLTSDRLTPTPFARAWPIEAALPFNLKHLRRALQERDVGRITVKKRGSPITPEELTRRLRLSGSREQVVVLTQVQDAPTVLLCGPPLSWEV